MPNASPSLLALLLTISLPALAATPEPAQDLSQMFSHGKADGNDDKNLSASVGPLVERIDPWELGALGSRCGFGR